MMNEEKATKEDDVTIRVGSKLWTIETLTHTVKTNEDELLELSTRGEHLLNLNTYYEGLIAEARKLGVKTAEELAAENKAEESKEEE